jgi:DNA-binding MarR family transcriptional regulator
VNFPDHGAVNAYTGFLLRKVSNASFRAFAQVAAEQGLHPMHFGMLSILEAEEPISQQELCARTGIDPSTMVARMDVLDDLGLVTRTRATEDRRSYEIRLSDAGRDVFAQLREQARECSERFLAPLEPSERQQLNTLLMKLAADVDERLDLA